MALSYVLPCLPDASVSHGADGNSKFYGKFAVAFPAASYVNNIFTSKFGMRGLLATEVCYVLNPVPHVFHVAPPIQVFWVYAQSVVTNSWFMAGGLVGRHLAGKKHQRNSRCRSRHSVPVDAAVPGRISGERPHNAFIGISVNCGLDKFHRFSLFGHGSRAICWSRGALQLVSLVVHRAKASSYRCPVASINGTWAFGHFIQSFLGESISPQDIMAGDTC